MSGRRRFREKGLEFWDKITKRDYDEGALQILVLGSKGCGKTTLLAHLAYAGLENKDIVIWRGRSRDFWPRFDPELVKVHVFELDEIHVWRIPYGSAQREEITDNYEVIKYKDLDELLEQLEPGGINVVYEPTWTQLSKEILTLAGLEDGSMYPGVFWWYDLFLRLSKRIDMRWVTLIIDEIDDIVPSGASGAQWRLIEVIQHALAEFREKLVSLYGSTHDPGHLDHRVLKKFSGFIYLKGAIVPKFSMMRYKTSTLGLEKGKGTIEIIGEGYGGFEFENIPRDGYGYAIEKIWRGSEPQGKPKRKRGILQEMLEIAKQYGPKRALEELEELRRRGEISERYYYLVKRKIRELAPV